MSADFLIKLLQRDLFWQFWNSLIRYQNKTTLEFTTLDSSSEEGVEDENYIRTEYGKTESCRLSSIYNFCFGLYYVSWKYINPYGNNNEQQLNSIL